MAIKPHNLQYSSIYFYFHHFPFGQDKSQGIGQLSVACFTRPGSIMARILRFNCIHNASDTQLDNRLRSFYCNLCCNSVLGSRLRFPFPRKQLETQSRSRSRRSRERERERSREREIFLDFQASFSLPAAGPRCRTRRRAAIKGSTAVARSIIHTASCKSYRHIFSSCILSSIRSLISHTQLWLLKPKPLSSRRHNII